jgi:hypothetical protein
MNARNLAVLGAACLMATGFARSEAAEVYSPRSFDEVRAQALRWTAQHPAKQPEAAAQITALWAPGAATSSSRDLFERVIETLCLADPEVRRFVEACGPGRSTRELPAADFLSRDESDEFAALHLRLYYARSLAQKLLFDEALAQFARIDPARVVDPATALFYRAVCEHQLLMKKEGLETLDKLLHRTQGASEPYLRVALLMHDELESIDEKSLGAVSRKMKDSQRRLDLGRGGQRVQKVQAEIIETLDEIIKKAEQQANAQAQAGQGENNSNRAGGPADDSRIKGATAPGNVDKKNLKKQGSWGSLPPKDEARALNMLNRDFPPNYRQAVEEYFKKLAKRPSAKGP